MSEVSFPVVNKPLSEDQWKTIAMGFAQGVIDRGGWPYLLTGRDNVTNEVTIGVDQVTGKNEAILGGFVHRIDHAKKLPIPAVTTTTTYEVGLVYDPLNHGTEAGPIKLDVWTAPGDYSQGKLRLILYRITRSPNQTLTNATVQEWRQRISPQISVSNQSDLPKAETVLVDTIALVRNGNKWFRSHKDVSTGIISWTEVGSSLPPAEVTHVADSLALRDSAGRLRVATPSHDNDAVNRAFANEWFWGRGEATGGTVDAAGKLVLRGTDANFLVPLNPTHSQHPTPKSYVDNKTWDGERLNKNGNPVWWELIQGSIPAYNRVASGTNYTVSVEVGGRLARFSSTKRHKTNIRPWEKDPRELLAVVPSIYDRINPDTGEVTTRGEVGVTGEQAEEAGVTEFVQYGPDKIGDDVTEEQRQIRVQGWSYDRWSTAHQFLHRWQTRRVDAIVEAVRRVADQTGVDLSDLLKDMEG